MPDEPAYSKLLWSDKTGGALTYSYNVSMSQDGSHVAVERSDHKLYYYDRDGELLFSHKITGWLGTINAISISDDGTYIAAGSSDSRIYFFNNKGELLWNYKTAWLGTVNGVSTSQDGSFTAAGASDFYVYCFNRDGEVLWSHQTDGLVQDVSITQDGSFIAAGSDDKKVYFFNQKGELLWEYKIGSNIEGILVSCDGSYIALRSKDKKIYFFNRDGELLWSYPINSQINCISLSKDGAWLVVGSQDNNISFFDNKGKLHWSYETGNSVEDVAISKDGNYISAGSKDKKLYFLNHSGEVLWDHQTDDNVEGVSISRDGSYVAALNYNGKVLFFQFDKEMFRDEIAKQEFEARTKQEAIENLITVAMPETMVYGVQTEINVSAFNTLDKPAKNLIVDFTDASKYFELSEKKIKFPELKSNMRLGKTIHFKPLYEGSFKVAFKVKSSIGDHVQNVIINVAESGGMKTVSIPTKSSTIDAFPPELEHLYYDPELIGKGGFARVFKVKRKSDNNVVAVKIPINLDETTGKSFVKEISLWNNLKHNNIIDLYDLNVLPIPYLEFEYADNKSMEDLAKPVELEIAGRLMFQIAEGLDYAHAKGIIHRDLKPQNILMTSDLVPKITDWGLSKLLTDSKTSSRYGFSPLYAAPEQLSPKKFGVPDARTDIYQMGMIFYDLVTGTLPFEGDDFSEIGFAIINEVPDAPSTLNPDCGGLDNIILKCLKKQPNERYQTVAEFQQDLAEYLKVEYNKLLIQSAGNLKRSCIYCSDLVLLYVKIGDLEGALKYAVDMKNYASGSDDLDDIVKQLEYLTDRKRPIGAELMTKIGVVMHQLKLGR